MEESVAGDELQYNSDLLYEIETMKSGVSSLNPYAASYIPLSKRAADDKMEVLKATTIDSNNLNETVYFGPSEANTQNSYQGKASIGSETLPIPEVISLKNHPNSGSYGSSSQHLNEKSDKQRLDDEFDMDLEYLQMTFPGVSVQSITDVYMANKGDLEATIDMLDQLESYTFDSAESLPETLDIGDISVSGAASSESATLKLKEVVGEACSSSGSLDGAIAT